LETFIYVLKLAELDIGEWFHNSKNWVLFDNWCGYYKFIPIKGLKICVVEIPEMIEEKYLVSKIGRYAFSQEDLTGIYISSACFKKDHIWLTHFFLK